MLTWAFQGGVVLHASSSLGGEGVQECRYAWGGHDAAERDGGASGAGYSLAVPYSYPLDYPETHNPLAYFAALWRERGGGERWGPATGAKLLGSEPQVTVEPWAPGCLCLCGIQARVSGLTTTATGTIPRSNTTKPNPQPSKQTQEHPPRSK